jgi:hypothetical protein
MSDTATATKRSPRFPVEEPMMVRYSPHHEFPLSTVSSIALHVLVIGLLIIGGIIIAKLNWGGDQKPVEADAVAMDQPGGGGGNPDGVGNARGNGAVGDPDAPETPLPDEPFEIGQPREKLQEAREEARKLPDFKDEEDQRLMKEGGAAVDKILRLKSNLRENLTKGLAAGKGRGGPGGGGGERTGQGTGTGGGVGPGSGTIDKRKERVLRWTLIFNTRDGQDYMRQLKACGAIVAVPDDNAEKGYRPIRDLNRDQPRMEDTIGRIFWVDDGPGSVRSLAGALGVPPPPYFLVFFPGSFEEKLLRLELGFRGKMENEISETRFDIRRRGDTYEPIVLQQR